MTDDDLRDLLADVARDVPESSDDESLARLRQAARRRPTGRWAVRLAPLAVAAAALAVFGLVRLFDDTKETTLDTTGSPPSTASEPTTVSPPSTASEPTTPADSSTTTGGDGEPGGPPDPSAPALVVVEEHGSRVVVYFPDSRDPLTYEPREPVVHAAPSADGEALWLTREDPVSYETTLELVDPPSGEVLEALAGAGYAAVSPDRSRLAYSIVSVYGGTDQAVVIRDLSTGDERTIPGDREQGNSIAGAFRQLWWSPDGRRLLVDENWEDDVVWIVDLETAQHVSDGLALGLEGADWLADDRLLATKHCCYSEPDVEPRHLVEVDLSGAEPRFIDRPERALPITAAVPGQPVSAAVYVDDDGRLRRVGDGSVLARSVIAVAW